MVECRHVADPPDEGLKARLRPEAGRILRWVLDAGQRPAVPVAINNAGAAYRAESDALGEWLDARAVLDPTISRQLPHCGETTGNDATGR